MTEPTTPDTTTPDPVTATAPTAEPAEGEVDDILDAPDTAPGFPPALGGVPGAGMPGQRPL